MGKEVDKVNHSLPQQPGEVIETIHAIMHLVRARQYRGLGGQDGAAGEISHMETRVLGYFARHPGATQRDLVQHSGRDKAQVTRLVQGLRDKGLLDARPDEADRRSTRLFLSSAGDAVFAQIHRQGQQLAELALADLGPQERAQLAGLLGRIEARLRAGQD